MISLFGNKKDLVLGIDISTTAVKIVQLSIIKTGEYKLVNYGIGYLPENSVVDKNIEDVDSVGEVLSYTLKRMKSKVKFAALAVPANTVSTKIVKIEKELKYDEFEEELLNSAEKAFSYPLEELSIDYEILDSSNDQYNEVFIIAARQEAVDVRMEVLAEADLTAKIIDTDYYATERAYNIIKHQVINQNPNAIIALVDIGHFVTNIRVFHNDEVVYTREQMFGGKQLTDEIVLRFEIDEKDAEEEKIKGTNLPPEYKEEVLQPFCENVANQILRAFQFFFADGNFFNVDFVFLAGGIASVEGLSKIVEDKIGVQARVANPFSFMSIDSKINVKLLNQDAPALFIACGLALRSFE